MRQSCRYCTKSPTITLRFDVVAVTISTRPYKALNEQKHAITVYGINQPRPVSTTRTRLRLQASRNHLPRLKLSQEITSINTGRRNPFVLLVRTAVLYWCSGGQGRRRSVAGERILCRHAFVARKRANVTPSRVEALHTLVFEDICPGANRSLGQAKKGSGGTARNVPPRYPAVINPTPIKCLSL
jgi:hypothetical protein